MCVCVFGSLLSKQSVRNRKCVNLQVVEMNSQLLLLRPPASLHGCSVPSPPPCLKVAAHCGSGGGAGRPMAERLVVQPLEFFGEP